MSMVNNGVFFSDYLFSSKIQKKNNKKKKETTKKVFVYDEPTAPGEKKGNCTLTQLQGQCKQD